MLARHKHQERELAHLFTYIFVWFPLPFFIMLDVLLELAQRVSFPIYGVELVNRHDYIQIIDRNKLKYLTWPQKIGCMYCGYANGLLLFLKEITGRTETYWCGVMHEGKPGFKTDPDQVKHDFPKFGDEEGFVKKYGHTK